MFHSAALDITEPLVELFQGSIRPGIQPPKLLIEFGQDCRHLAFGALRCVMREPRRSATAVRWKNRPCLSEPWQKRTRWKCTCAMTPTTAWRSSPKLAFHAGEGFRRFLVRTRLAELGEGHEGIPWFDFWLHRTTPLTYVGTKTAELMLKNFASLPASVALILRLPARMADRLLCGTTSARSPCFRPRVSIR